MPLTYNCGSERLSIIRLRYILFWKSVEEKIICKITLFLCWSECNSHSRAQQILISYRLIFQYKHESDYAYSAECFGHKQMTNDFLLHTALSAPTAPTRVADVSVHLPKVKRICIFLRHSQPHSKESGDRTLISINRPHNQPPH